MFILAFIIMVTPWTVGLPLIFVSSLETLLFLRNKNQDIVSLPSIETGYYTMSSTTTKIVQLCLLPFDMSVPLPKQTLVNCGNKSSIQNAHNLLFHKFMEHIEIHCYLTRHHLQHKIIILLFVSFYLHITNLFTKIHLVEHFCFLIDKILMLHVNAS